MKTIFAIICMLMLTGGAHAQTVTTLEVASAYPDRYRGVSLSEDMTATASIEHDFESWQAGAYYRHTDDPHADNYGIWAGTSMGCWIFVCSGEVRVMDQFRHYESGTVVEGRVEIGYVIDTFEVGTGYLRDTNEEDGWYVFADYVADISPNMRLVVETSATNYWPNRLNEPGRSADSNSVFGGDVSLEYDYSNMTIVVGVRGAYNYDGDTIPGEAFYLGVRMPIG